MGSAVLRFTNATNLLKCSILTLAFGLDDGKFPDCICCAVIQRAYLSSLLPLLILLNISSNVFSTSLHVTYVFLMAPSIPFTHVILIILYFTLFV